MNDKLDLASLDGVQKNIELLASIFPNCVTESAEGKVVDIDVLKQELNYTIVEGNKERYRLEWPGKREAIITANTPINKTLRPVPEDSVDFDTTENIYIEGDNLEVLKLLQESYLGKIKMIYIDPPYNTGKDFVYKDNFTKSGEEELLESGQKDEYNQRLVANPETSGRYHSDWLSMMYPRLKLARNLLTEDGVIFISIDDNEVHNLRKICDEIFGDDNFIANFIHKNNSNKNQANLVSVSCEYFLCYSRNREILNKEVWRIQKKGASDLVKVFNDLKKQNWSLKDIHLEIKDLFKRAKYAHLSRWNKIDDKGIFMDDNLSREGGPKDYSIINPETGEFAPIPPRGWGKSKEELERLLKEDLIYFGDPTTPPRIKSYITGDDYAVPDSFWYIDNSIDTRWQKNEFGRLIFDNPKPLELLKLLGEMSTKDDAIILDFFSGSATTAHAVMQLNAEDASTSSAQVGKRKYIMVQLPEDTDEKSEAYKAGYKNICEIGKERIRRAAKKLKEDTNADIDYGFRVFRLDSSNLEEVSIKPQELTQSSLDLFSDNIKEGRTPLDLVAQVMLNWGLPLSLPITVKNIADKEVYSVAEDALYCCFDQDIDEAFAKEIAKDQPMRIVFRDNSFKDDTAKENVKQLLKQLTPNTEMKVV